MIGKATATVTFSNLNQTYTGSALSPTVTTVPSGLTITPTGYPDTAAGSYSVTATVNDPNYTGSASGTFVIGKATATVTFSNLNQTYTGSALSPTVTTAPSGLSISPTEYPTWPQQLFGHGHGHRSELHGSASGTFGSAKPRRR